MDVQEALEHFENHPEDLTDCCRTLHDVGLDYMKLGQPSPTLSGGEAQRIKLARELGKRSTGNTLYLLDEPTTGLHFADVKKLLEVLHGFVDAGNTVLVVEHNLDVIKTADWIIDLGPEGGDGGGTIVAAGTPEEIAACHDSHTGQALRDVLDSITPQAESAKQSGKPKSNADNGIRDAIRDDSHLEIIIRGAAQHNLQRIDVDVPRDKMSVFCGPSGIGQELAGDGHAVCRGPAAVRRIAVGLRPAVPRPDAQAAGRAHLTASRRRSPSNRRPSAQRRVRPSAPSRKSTTTCACCSPGWARCTARTARSPSKRQTTDEIIDRILSLDRGTRLYLAAPIEVPVGQSLRKVVGAAAGAGLSASADRRRTRTT